jgi:hypothetical protein
LVFTVYISYSRENEELVNSLYSVLKQNGINVYIYQTDYVANLEEDALSNNVKGFIRSSDCVLLFLTKDIVGSPNVLWEIDVASTLQRPIILVVESGIDIPPNLRHLLHVVLDRKNPESTIEQIKQLSMRLKSAKEKGQSIIGILFLLAALGIILYIASDQR